MKRINIQKITYMVNHMIKNIRKGYELDEKRMLSSLQVIRSYFISVNDKKTSNRTYAIERTLRWGKYGTDKVLGHLMAIKKVADKNLEKVKEMETKEAESRINYHRISQRHKKNKEASAGISKFDIIKAPTQGGVHYCVIYEIYENGTAVCYPFTTSSEHDLRILGNKSWKINDCGLDMFNGSRLSSHATVVNINDAGYFKISHLSKHTEIDRAILYFNDQQVG